MQLPPWQRLHLSLASHEGNFHPPPTPFLHTVLRWALSSTSVHFNSLSSIFIHFLPTYSPEVSTEWKKNEVCTKDLKAGRANRELWSEQTLPSLKLWKARCRQLNSIQSGNWRSNENHSTLSSVRPPHWYWHLFSILFSAIRFYKILNWFPNLIWLLIPISSYIRALFDGADINIIQSNPIPAVIPLNEPIYPIQHWILF